MMQVMHEVKGRQLLDKRKKVKGREERRTVGVAKIEVCACIKIH